MKTSLSAIEVRFYIAAWAAGVAASAYHYYIGQEELLATKQITTHQIPGLTEGWNAVQRLKDNSDADWSAWKHYLLMAGLPLIIHFMVSELLRNSFVQWMPFWYILFTTVFISFRFKFAQTLLLFTQPIVFALMIHLTKKKVWIWMTSLILLALLNYLKKDVLFWYLFEQNLDVTDIFLVLISLSWIHVRCISFSLDHIDRLKKATEKRQTDGIKEKFSHHSGQLETRETEININAERKVINEEIKHLQNIGRFQETVAGIMSYSLFFPTLFMGPLVLYSDFNQSLNTLEKSLSERLKRFAKDITIFLAEACLLELILHYLYFMAMKQDVRLVRMLRNSGLCGAGLFMGVQFFLKYLIMYGASGALVALHGASPPPAPRCILRVHLYSHMWKHFDVGLYRFLVKYMYRPTLAALSAGGRSTATHKLLAAALTFSFIFLWHGTTRAVLLWSSLNFAGVALEALATSIGSTRTYDTFRARVLMTPQAEERFIAVISTPMLIMSFASNIYFFAGIEVGNVFVERFFSERWYNILLVCFCLHACCHGSAALADVPSRTDERKCKGIKT